jgi:indolepyruvate ferredoxin oxidoreductase beta subunit
MDHRHLATPAGSAPARLGLTQPAPVPDQAASRTVAVDTKRPLAIAVLAMGGQGGGVLVDWIVALAQAEGNFVQSTSVPGVAQRTGATIYYVETIAADGTGRRPILSLMPSPGEVDIVIGAELMEAGRAMQRGLVTPDRTLLIASSHRAYAVSEKIAPGDGAGDPAKVYEAAIANSRRFLAFDMAAIAEADGSVISAALFGALAASRALPFPRGAFERTIRAAGIGIEASLRTFARAYDRAEAELRAPGKPTPPAAGAPGKRFPKLEPIGDAGYDALISEARDRLPEAAHPMAAAGLARVVDFQDVDYGREYLGLVASFAEIERQTAGNAADWPLTRAAAKHIARAMAYDDVIRVADLKTRATRFARVRGEVAAKPAQIVHMTEFMHPRMEEVSGTLPRGLGLWIEAHPSVFKAMQRWVSRGRHVRTDRLHWFLALYCLAGLRRYRRGTLRHHREAQQRDAWLEQARAAARHDSALGLEVLEAYRLVKGYSDTHAGGAARFATVLAIAARLAGRSDAADWLRRLSRAALTDAEGSAFTDTVKTIESFL